MIVERTGKACEIFNRTSSGRSSALDMLMQFVERNLCEIFSIEIMGEERKGEEEVDIKELRRLIGELEILIMELDVKIWPLYRYGHCIADGGRSESSKAL